MPHGYIAQSASDLMLFTNPLIQDTLPPDWESRRAPGAPLCTESLAALHRGSDSQTTLKLCAPDACKRWGS